VRGGEEECVCVGGCWGPLLGKPVTGFALTRTHPLPARGPPARAQLPRGHGGGQGAQVQRGLLGAVPADVRATMWGKGRTPPYTRICCRYDGHHMAVYAVRWNPYHPRVFLSCSAGACARGVRGPEEGAHTHAPPAPCARARLDREALGPHVPLGARHDVRPGHGRGRRGLGALSSTVFAAVTDEGKVRPGGRGASGRGGSSGRTCVRCRREGALVCVQINPACYAGTTHTHTRAQVDVYDLHANKHEQLCEQKIVKKAKCTHVCFNAR